MHSSLQEGSAVAILKPLRREEELDLATDTYVDYEGLYAALDQSRQDREWTWRQVAADAGTSASTFTRIAQGRGTDAATFAKLVDWLGLAAEHFIKRSNDKPKRTETMAAISTQLRADRALSPKAVAALEDIIGVAYKTLANEKKGRSAQRIQERG